MDWDILLFPYLFPLSPILPVVLQKVKQSNNTFLVIASLWPHQSWYPDLISVSMDHPLCLPQGEDLLVQDLPKRFWIRPNPVVSPPNSRCFGKHCGRDCLASERLHRTPPQCQVGRVLLLVPSTESRSCLSRCSWSICSIERPHWLSILLGGFSRRCQPLYNVVDLTNLVFLRNLLKNMDLQRPKYKELCPKWNLALVLAYITSPLFETIMKASFCHLTLKTVFLLKLASGVTETSFMPFPAMRKVLSFQGRRGSGYPHYRTGCLGQEPETSRLYASDSYPSVRAFGEGPPRQEAVSCQGA